MFYANLSILFVGLIETKTILYLLKIPFQFLAPMILMLASIGAYISGLVLGYRNVYRRDNRVFTPSLGLLNPGIVLSNSWKNRRTEFCSGYANGSLRFGDLFSSSICTILIFAGVLTLLKVCILLFFRSQKFHNTGLFL